MKPDFITTNRDQMASAIRAVAYGQRTIIEGINKAVRVIVRYTFPGDQNLGKKYHERHINNLARNVLSTPAAAWK